MRTITLGPVRLALLDGDLRAIRLDGVEVLRRLSYPVRDPYWGTHPTETLGEILEEGPDRFLYEHRFAGRGVAFTGCFRAEVTLLDGGARLSAEVALDAPADLAVNRAGFTLLHPLRGVSGAPLRVRHADGREEETVWPALISPGQPVFDIAGLAHEVEGVAVEIALRGEVFEMEDQRNWSDASFKTYCRPLRLPLPFSLGPSAPVRQAVEITMQGQARRAAARAAPARIPLPQVMVAVEPGLTTLPHHPALPDLPRSIRLTPEVPDAVLAGLGGGRADALEIILPEGADPGSVLPALAARLARAGLAPARVMALPAPYLKSHQPEGPWPEGPRPMELIAPLRAAFPGVALGGGMLTNFTEFNRCRPDPTVVDYVTWGGTAIVHAADDLSVLETLEALPEIFASGRALAGGKPLHLGLFSIGMRSNPYAPDCLPNPGRERLAMVRDDPRQGTGFDAAFAVGVLAGAAVEGVASLALGMTDGPLGARGDLARVMAWAAARAGEAVEVDLGPVVAIRSARGRLIANATLEARETPFGGGVLAPASVVIEGEG
ncbi:hypothetical protein C0V75_09675 [Tabrizicola sp. TH137]|uniref:hypothetical protein n=1 Tax=Tabrizicola sp. TH137 TaxID=2067452 RepID=UPI000C7AD769|nr:hypothetical protein [Tabrizicola sp. TH137]PLL13616.1 hypothetical protein C0V75_09675 [Tabrizicola sp. TH137]